MGKKILLVDDEHNVLKLLEMTIDGDYDAVLAKNGYEAVNKALIEKPDTIVLDLMMPHMDGFQVLENLQKHHVTKDIPVIVLSALHSTEVRDRAMQLGASDYMIKPFTPDDLRFKLKLFS